VCIQPIITARRYKRRSGKSGIEIGAGASKFLRCEGFLSKFSQTCPKSCRATFADCFFRLTKINLSSFVFLQTLGVIFQSQTPLGAILCPDFQRFCLDILRFCLDFQGFCPNFQGLCPVFNNSKLLGVCLHPMHPRLLNHWTRVRLGVKTKHIFFPKTRKILFQQ